MLKALFRWLWPPEPPGRIKDAVPDYITRAEFEREIEAVKKDADFLFNEWHEKFSTLHARLTKRIQRATHTEGGKAPSHQGNDEERPEGLPSALSFRKPWSV